MKYCPTCQSHFDGDEAFCPHDGTRLLAEGSYQAGRLAGSSLGGIVNLEAFLFADHLGERYRGRLLSDNTEVQVLVFHRRYDQNRIREALSTLQTLSPLPPQILSTHSIIGDSEPAFLVEERPQKESLAHILKKKGQLPWRQAVHLTIKLARILDWLATQGVAHRALHPRSLFVDNPAVNPIQVGELGAGLITFPLPRLDEATPRGSLPIYAGHLAPEWITTPDSVDLQQAAAYSLGAILLEALGAPILPEQNNQFSIKNWLDQEIAPTIDLKLADDAPTALQDLAMMLASPNIKTRFQSAKAAMAALSSLVEGDLEEIAPPLSPRATKAFSTKPRAVTQPVALPDSSEVTDDVAETGGTLVTHIGLPAQAMTENSEGSQSGLASQSPRVITEASGDGEEPHHGDTLQMKASDLAREVSKDLAKDSEPEEQPKDSKASDQSSQTGVTNNDSDEDVSGATLLMGAAEFKKAREEARELSSPPDETSSADDTTGEDDTTGKDDKTGEDDTGDAGDIEEPPATADDGSKTRQLHAVDARAAIAARDALSASKDSEQPSEPDETAGEPDASDKPLSSDPTDSPSESAPSDKADVVSGESSINDREKSESTEEPAIIVDAHQGDDPKVVVDTEPPPQDDDSDDNTSPEESNSADVSPSVDTVDEEKSSDDANSESEKDEDPEDSTETSGETEESNEKPSDGLNIGFVEAKNPGNDEFTDAWFTRSNHDAWEDALVQEEYERTHRRERATRIGFIVGGLLLTVIVVIFTLTYEPEEEPEEPIAEVETPSPAVDVADLKAQFTRALDAGRILQPRPQSALQALREIRRHASPEEYDDARQQFVDAADAASRQAEANGDLFQARNLSGYASQYEPDDADLRARAEDIQARYLALQEGNLDILDDENSNNGDTDANGEDDSSDSAPPQEGRSSTGSSRPSSPPSQSSAPSASPAELFRRAQAADEARDYEEARSLYLELLQASPNHTEGNANLAKIYFDVDADHRSAIRYQRRAVESAPTNVDHRVQLGRLHFRLAEYEEAIEIWEEVLQLDPDHSEAERWIGLARRSMN